MEKKEITKQELADVNKLQQSNAPEVHRMTDHNFHIRRYGRCVYCGLGSEPLEDNLFYEHIKKKKTKKL